MNKRIDSCLLYLLKYVCDKTFDRLIKLTKGKTSSRIKTIHVGEQGECVVGSEIRDTRWCRCMEGEIGISGKHIQSEAVAVRMCECKLRTEMTGLSKHLHSHIL